MKVVKVVWLPQSIRTPIHKKTDPNRAIMDTRRMTTTMMIQGKRSKGKEEEWQIIWN